MIPQFGRVWREKADGDWSRAAFPIMLVNDTENHAHQGLATFLYRPGKVTGLQMQFIQQTGPGDDQGITARLRPLTGW